MKLNRHFLHLFIGKKSVNKRLKNLQNVEGEIHLLYFIGKARIEDINFALWAPDEHFSVLRIVINFEAM